jgi:hypothetical protein
VPVDTNDVALEDFSDDVPETADDMMLDDVAVLDIKVNTSPLRMTGLLGGRANAGRSGGGNGAPGPANQAVDNALAWLAKQQQADGRWPFNAHPNAVQASATLAFLGRGHTMESGEYKDVVRKSINNYIERMPKDGGLGNHGHATPFVTMALCDAYAMTPWNKRVKEAAEAAANYALRTQHGDGGWSGGRSPGTKQNEIDVAQTGWWTMALISAKLAGMEVPQDRFLRIRNVLMQVAEGRYPGTVLFTSHGGRESTYDKNRSIKSTIFTMLHFLGVPRNNPTIQRLAKELIDDLPGRQKRNYWVMYNMGMGMFQMGPSDPSWKTFNVEVIRKITEDMTRSGKTGYWPAPNGLFGGKGTKGDTGENSGYWGDCGRTGMAVLNLEVYYRYGDIHQVYAQYGGIISEKQIKGGGKEKKKQPALIGEGDKGGLKF